MCLSATASCPRMKSDQHHHQQRQHVLIGTEQRVKIAKAISDWLNKTPDGDQFDDNTKDDIKGLRLKVYNKSVPGVQSKLRKPDYVKALEKQFHENIGRYEEYIVTLELEYVTP